MTTQEPLSFEKIFKAEKNKLWEPPYIYHTVKTFTVKTFTDAIEKELLENEHLNSLEKPRG